MALMQHDTVRRAARTFVQAFIGALLVLLPTDLIPDASLYVDAISAAGYAAVVAVLTWLHNELEDAGRVRDTRQPKASR